MYHHPQAVALLQAMADPVRLSLLECMSTGPVVVSDLAATTGQSQSNVSNHLALLRKADVVTATKIGRQVQYEVRDHVVIEIMEALKPLISVRAGMSAVTPELIQARTCYDHLAGRLGVAVFEALVASKALHDVPVPRALVRKVRGGLGPVALGAAAETVFARLGVDLEAASARKRQFASACKDWTEDRPHLGGALGAAVADRLFELGWVERRRDSRALRVTPRGRRGLTELGAAL